MAHRIATICIPLQSFLSVIFRTAVQQLTRFQPI